MTTLILRKLLALMYYQLCKDGIAYHGGNLCIRIVAAIGVGIFFGIVTTGR